jgi:hypothetical protein
MYISENYLCFYSFVLGTETKVLVELKDIGDLKKEKSKRGVFADAIYIKTKNQKEASHMSKALYSSLNIPLVYILQLISSGRGT